MNRCLCAKRGLSHEYLTLTLLSSSMMKQAWVTSLTQMSLISPTVMLEALKPVYCSQLNEHFASLDLLQYRTFGYGHSFGILSHYYGREAGLELREDINTVLEPNMVVSIEPMLTIPDGQKGAGGYREHDASLGVAGLPAYDSSHQCRLQHDQTNIGYWTHGYHGAQRPKYPRSKRGRKAVTADLASLMTVQD